MTAIPAGPLVALARGGVKPDADNPFRDKIVLVGATFPESRDHYPTPVGLMAGVEIHANIIETLLSRRTLLPPPLGLNLAVLAAACLAVALLSAWLRPLWVAGGQRGADRAVRRRLVRGVRARGLLARLRGAGDGHARLSSRARASWSGAGCAAPSASS